MHVSHKRVTVTKNGKKNSSTRVPSCSIYDRPAMETFSNIFAVYFFLTWFFGFDWSRFFSPPPLISVNLKGSLQGLTEIFFSFSNDEATETKLTFDEFGRSVIRNLYITDSDKRKSFVQSLKVRLPIWFPIFRRSHGRNKLGSIRENVWLFVSHLKYVILTSPDLQIFPRYAPECGHLYLETSESRIETIEKTISCQEHGS